MRGPESLGVGKTGWTRRLLLGAGGWLAACTTVPGRLVAYATTAASAAPGSPFPLAARRVGIGYALWHEDDQWRHDVRRPWGTPAAGFYRSDDPAVLTRHAAQLSGAGVDFIVVDWSNDTGMDVRITGKPSTQRFIEQATVRLFDVWAPLAPRPLVTIMLGVPGHQDAASDGTLSAKADEVHALFVADPARARLLQTYLGKPLLLVYANTPSFWQKGLPPWHDDRFTVRFVTGFLTQQPNLIGPPGLSRYGYWSWEDRVTPICAVSAGHPECMTVVASWRGINSPGRDGGRTYLAQWTDARRIGPHFVLAGTFNEWWISEQIDPLHSKDVEPSQELGSGSLDILRQQAALFRQGR
nr:hypothetical protein [uncultured Lichenicoccus sp.]